MVDVRVVGVVITQEQNQYQGTCTHCRQQIVLTDIGLVHVVNGQDQGWLCPPSHMALATPASTPTLAALTPPPAPPEPHHSQYVQPPPLPRRRIPPDWPAPRSVQSMMGPHGTLRAAQ